MIVGMWMSRDLVVVTPETPIADAAILMAHRGIRRLLVVQQEQDGPYLLGIVSARDILHACPPDVNPFATVVKESPQQQNAVRDIMHANPTTVVPELPIEEAATIMRNRKIGALPVVRDGKLLGIITESDIFRAFVSIFASPQPGVRITFATERFENAFDVVSDLMQGYSVHVLSLITSMQADTPVCVVRCSGPEIESMLEAIWKSRHRILNIVRMPGGMRS